MFGPSSSIQEYIDILKKQDYSTFSEMFVFLDPKVPNYSYFLAHQLLYTLLKTKRDYYLMFEKIIDFENQYILFVVDVERAFNTGNKMKLVKFSEKMPEFSYVINLLLNNEDKKLEDDMYVEKERDIERIKECINILNTFNKI